MTAAELEAKRILAEYERREREIGRSFYSLTRPANLFARQGQQRALLRALERAGALPLTDKRILEVGCGLGQWLSVFEDFGARRDRLAGVDLDASRIEETRARFPSADLQVGDAARLTWASGSFDVVFQSLVFTSILDEAVRASVADEMRRVLVPGGVILWYDFTYDNPANSNVRGIRSSVIARLFPDCSIEVERVTLAPLIARRLVPRSWIAAAALERIRVLNTHYFGLIRPR